MNAEHPGRHTGTTKTRNWRHETEPGYTLDQPLNCPEKWDHFKFRSFIRNRFAANILGEGTKKLYISRTNMWHVPGQLLFEHQLEESARAEGYEIFHPQDHDLENQIKRYRAAEKILGVEGSAFHMVAFTARSPTTIGMIRRRKGSAPAGYVEQIAKITQTVCHDIDYLTETFILPKSLPMSNGVPNLVSLYAKLGELGFFEADHGITPPSTAEIEAEKDRLRRAVFAEA